ncbi:hypothetical protein BBO99_00009315 [Phytophthora kernoviae]|uniref:Tyrosinase copper-binding domain-containing protein n=2 Tax=Phytophthora kernoviae TaxID=325452 RepID=A0A3R7MJX7_9STRA|nr:hypothetical protein G195_010960 [Phytophthora kernoviae 00238/432]KAG2506574.1 hypothetical protein JM16_009157 [Phytophthora kernoviae]KAG2508255.1 hypothetical protein JM18_009211 [Phytophthora kernoviae]RLM96208.1 hypothetical protein BBI17_009323 [Phytophthora kernoviae]RLN73591.1 hypothetical protein BBO99_00009315 [Phytophthora kernoviae]
MKLSWILSLGLLACVVTQTPANAQNIYGPRVRRNWESLSGSEKDTYKRAIAAAMDSGAYIKFVEMHMETMSNMEAHKQCMFIYWHRYFLIAFENMLCGQGDEFACVTIPYFNWMVAQSRQMNGECTSFGDCAAIATELGGFTSGSTQQGVINGDAINGNVCVNNMSLNHFCGSSAPGTACAGCLPRGNWGSISLPAAAGYGSVRGQVFEGQNINQTSTKIETGAHGSVHSSLGSTMGTLASPADPIFWSHHSMVDALHTIFHKCRVGTQRMSFEEKASNPIAWSSCSRRDNDGDQFNEGSVFNPTDIVTMRTGPKNANPVNGSEDPIIGKFIRGVPNRFADLVDNGTATIDPSKINPTYDDGKVDVIILNECSEAEQRVMTWYKQTTATMGGQTAETMADLERQSCMFHEQCLGGVTGFSEEFKVTWGFKGDRCKIIVDAVQCGDQQIIYTQWRENMEAYFGCPVPANTTTPAPTNQNQTSSSNQTSPTDQTQQVVGDNMGNTIAGAINNIVQSV